MQTLFIEKPAMELRYERACLLLYEEGKRVGSVPLATLERLVVAPHVVLSAGVLGIAAEHHVDLLVLNSRYPERSALLSGTSGGDVHRRMAQYEAHHDMAFRLLWARRLVWLKTCRQRALLTKLRGERPDLRHPLSNGINALEGMLDGLLDAEVHSSLASLRGVEGSAAAVYFAAYATAFAAALGFAGRNRRPPRDPVNACLSLTYTLAHQEAVNAVKAAGLDPQIGCFHDLYYGRDSLACDLLEPVRPLLDEWVYRLFQLRALRPEDFKQEAGACLLMPAGKRRFYEAMNGKNPSLKRLMRRYARIAAVAVCEHGGT
jgi:CRISPR-associated protein Cas1